MPEASNINDKSEIATEEDERPLDPAEAARLIETARLRARRQLSSTAPLISLMGAVVVLVCYGLLWLSVRGQQPYEGPSLAAIGLVYLLVALSAIIGTRFYAHAMSGVTGPSKREERLRGISFAVPIAGFYTFLGALHHDGFSPGVVYGVVDASGPWIVAGAVLVAWGAAKEDWWKLGGGTGVVIAGTASAFFGPSNCWGILAIAGSIGFVGHALAHRVWDRCP
jgi:hypothetical protein